MAYRGKHYRKDVWREAMSKIERAVGERVRVSTSVDETGRVHLDTRATEPAELQARWETEVAEVLRKAEQAERKARGKRLTWLRQEQERWARLADRASGPPERATAGGAAKHAHGHSGRLGSCAT